MKRVRKGLFSGVLCFFICAAAGLAALVGCDLLYRADVRLLNIPKASGLAEEDILRNYHAAVRYLLPWQEGDFALRGLTWSADGAEFFRQLRICVLAVWALGLSAGVFLILLHRRGSDRFLWNISGTFTLFFTAVAGAFMALDFTGVQQTVCRLLFRDSWLLYEDLDPIVTIFPQSYFVHAGFFILFVCVAGSLLQFAAGRPAQPAQERPAQKQPRTQPTERPAADVGPADRPYAPQPGEKITFHR